MSFLVRLFKCETPALPEPPRALSSQEVAFQRLCQEIIALPPQKPLQEVDLNNRVTVLTAHWEALKASGNLPKILATQAKAAVVALDRLYRNFHVTKPESVINLFQEIHFTSLQPQIVSLPSPQLTTSIEINSSIPNMDVEALLTAEDVETKLQGFIQLLQHEKCFVLAGSHDLVEIAKDLMQAIFQLPDTEQSALAQGEFGPHLGFIFQYAMKGVLKDADDLLCRIQQNHGAIGTYVKDPYKNCFAYLKFAQDHLLPPTFDQILTTRALLAFLECVSTTPDLPSTSTIDISFPTELHSLSALQQAFFSNNLYQKKQAALILINQIQFKFCKDRAPAIQTPIQELKARALQARTLEDTTSIRKTLRDLVSQLNGVIPIDTNALLNTLDKIEAGIIMSLVKNPTYSEYSQFDLPAYDAANHFQLENSPAHIACGFIAAYNVYLELKNGPIRDLDEPIYLGAKRGNFPRDLAEIDTVTTAFERILSRSEDIYSILRPGEEITQYEALLAQLALVNEGTVGAVIRTGAIFYNIVMKPGENIVISDSHGFTHSQGRAFRYEFSTIEDAAKFLYLRSPYNTNSNNQCDIYPFTLAAENATGTSRLASDRAFLEKNQKHPFNLLRSIQAIATGTRDNEKLKTCLNALKDVKLTYWERMMRYVINIQSEYASATPERKAEIVEFAWKSYAQTATTILGELSRASALSRK